MSSRHPTALPEVNCLEIGGSHLTTSTVSLRTGYATPADQYIRTPLDAAAPAQQLLACFADAVNSTRSKAPWAVALPGPFDCDAGVALYRGVGKFDQLFGVNVRRALAERTGRPTADFKFVNDAEAFGCGTHVAGPAAGADRWIGVTLGTGIGSVFFERGTAVRLGDNVPPGGELYRTRLQGQPLEETVSTRALIRAHGGGANNQVTGLKELADLARDGERKALGIINERFSLLGTELGRWAKAFQPDAIVVGGSMVRTWDLIGPPLAEGLGQTASLHPTGEIERLSHLGAAALCWGQDAAG